VVVMSNLFTPSVPTDLALQLNDGNTAQYPRAFVYAGATLAATVDLSHDAQGKYRGPWTPAAAVDYDAVYIVYSDAGRTAESPIYTRETERWQPASLAANPAAIAASVWNASMAAHTAAGSAGAFLNRLTAVRAALIDQAGADASLTRKIQTNRLELADGDSGNWVLYDDDSLTPLLTFSVSDKDGDPIVQPKLFPARRTKGV
jgi:hypothetical protein